jgi:hypothetical protein
MHFSPQKHTLIHSALRFQHLKITPKTAIFQGILVVVSTILFAVLGKTYAFSGKACAFFGKAYAFFGKSVR